jgi:peptidoglycan/LPS O-acetylase OafA/YrhL
VDTDTTDPGYTGYAGSVRPEAVAAPFGATTMIEEPRRRRPARPESGRPELPRGFRPDIEGLRAIAILLVVGYHAGVPNLTGGYVGVDVFFVISGYLITSHLVREAVGGHLSIARFYARRAMRLLPAAALVLAVTLLATWWWLPVTRLKSIAYDALAANGYVINYRLAALGTDYRTATAAPSPLQHFWSLAVEEQFYLVIPLLVLLTVVVARQRTLFVAAVAAITGASFWWSIHTTSTSAIWAYFGAPARVWELGAGALLGLAAVYFGRLPIPAAVVLRWAGIAAIGYAAVKYTESTPFPGYQAGLPVLGAVAVIGAGCANPGQGLGNPLFRSIGARSYSWYLWHWPVLLIAPFVVHQNLGLTGKLVALAVAYGFAAVSFAVVEQPIRTHPDLRAHPIRAFQVAVAVTAVVVALALVLPALPARTSLGVGNVASVTLGGTGSARTQALARRLQAATTVDTIPKNLTPSLKDAAGDNPPIYGDGCHLGFAETKTPSKCLHFGDAGGDRTMVLFGDSHAAQWFPAMNSIAKQRDLKLADFTKGACAAADVKIYLPAIKRAYDECVTWRATAIAQIKALHPAIVVMSSNYDGGDDLGIHGSQNTAWTKAWKTTTKQLTQAGTRLVYLNDTPWPKGNVPDCLAEHPTDPQRCAQKTSTAAGSPRRSMVAKAEKGLGATVVDPMPWFCALKSCPVVVGNIMVYMDDSHMSTDYAKLLTPLLSEQLKNPGRVKS